jgi:ABC-type antimicrobial peptide transport system permease subunit
VHYFLRHRAGRAVELEAPAVRQVLKAFNPNLPLIRDQRLRDLANLGLLPQRLAASVAGSLGLVALLLAAIGLYGVMAYAVAARTREIGVRMALGADRTAIMTATVRQALKLTTVGAIAGLAIALLVTRLLSSFLFGISPLDPLAFGATFVLLLGVAVAASLAPARRAADVDPLVALRTE